MKKPKINSNRILSFVLCFFLILNEVSFVYAADDENGALSAVAEEDNTEDDTPVPSDEDEEPYSLKEGDMDAAFAPGYIELSDDPVSPAIDDTLSFSDTRVALQEQDLSSLQLLQSTGEILSLNADDAAFPTSYDGEWLAYFADSYPSCRDQSPYGSCWAHSAMCLGEFYLIRHGFCDKNIDLSELHLVNWSYTNWSPSAICVDTGDRVSADNCNIVNNGGNLGLAAQVLARQRGFAVEAVAPYENAPSIAGGERLSVDTEKDDSYYLTNAYNINIKENPRLVKEAILENGAVGVSMYANTAFYNSDNNAYYCNYGYNTNHAVSIVGWDDDFPSTSFSLDPGSNGAWLIRNSWSTENKADYKSYFWLSYRDSTLTNAWVYELTDTFPYDNHYYYDSTIHNYGYYSSGVYRFANIYTANSASGAPFERLDKVGFEISRLGSGGSDYSIQIYTALSDTSDPCSGKLMSEATVNGKLYYTGSYTVELPEPVYLRKGELFSIVVTLPDGSSSVTVEGKLSNFGTINVSVGAGAGQSMVSTSANSSSWSDCGGKYGRNLVISALTNDLTEEDVDFSSLRLSNENLNFSYYAQTRQLKASAYDRLGNVDPDPVILWNSSDETVASVDENGNVMALSDGNAVISAGYLDKTASCNVCVKIQPKLYTVDFLSKGFLLYSEEVQNGDSVSFIPTPEEEGFLYWSLNKNGSEWAESAAITEDTILYAVFENEGSSEEESEFSGSGRSALDPLPDLTQSELYLIKGQQFYLPEDGGWYSENPSIAKISSKGKLKAKKCGVTAISGNQAYSVYVSQMSLNSRKVTLLPGESFELQLKADCAGEDLTKHYLQYWHSSNPSAAYVKNGTVIARGAGKAVITVYVNGSSCSAKVIVKAAISPSAIENGGDITLSPMQSARIKVNGYKFRNTVWTSEDSELKPVFGKYSLKYYENGIVRITPSGEVTAIGPGSCHISGGGAEFNITVNEPLRQLLYMNPGKSKSISLYKVNNSKAVWNSLTPSAALVNTKGKVTALSCGSALIQCQYEGFTYYCRVYIENPVLDSSNLPGLTQKKSYTYRLDLKQGESAQLMFLQDDDHLVEQAVFFKSSNASIVFVDENGNLEARRSGKVKCKAKINGKVITITIKVQK